MILKLDIRLYINQQTMGKEYILYNENGLLMRVTQKNKLCGFLGAVALIIKINSRKTQYRRKCLPIDRQLIRINKKLAYTQVRVLNFPFHNIIKLIESVIIYDKFKFNNKLSTIKNNLLHLILICFPILIVSKCLLDFSSLTFWILE